MRKIWLGIAGFAALGLSASAHAADLGVAPYVKAPMAEAIYDWSGLYAGINVGGGSACSSWKLKGATNDDPCHDATGATFGGQLGYRWQLSNIVLGVEAQGQWADLSATTTNAVVAFHTNVQTTAVLANPPSFHSRINGFGMFTGQIGYAWSNVLLYVKGGAAVADSKFTMANADGSIYAGHTRWGGTVGVGVEYGFAKDWSVAFEYDHLFLGGRDVTFSGPCDTSTTTNCVARIRQGVDVALLRLNYRFSAPMFGLY